MSKQLMTRKFNVMTATGFKETIYTGTKVIASYRNQRQARGRMIAELKHDPYVHMTITVERTK